VMSCVSCKKGHFGSTYRFHHQGEEIQRTKRNVSSNWQRRVLHFLDTVNVPSSLNLFPLMMEAIISSK
jgi:hypothetical protein